MYKVKQGDCISSIAFRSGLFWQTIWNHADNKQLKNDRKDPNALMPGDEVFVPDTRAKTASISAEAKHRFRRLGVPAKLRLQFLIDDDVRSNVKYKLYIDSELVKEDSTDGDGFLDESITPGASSGKVVLMDDDGNEEHYEFNLGTVDPLDTEEGVKKRLYNLGFDPSHLSSALKEFQEKHGLTVSGAIDRSTTDKLKTVFGQ